MPKNVFISYRRDDSKYQARTIYESFRQVLGREHVFMDIDSIAPGSNFREVLKGWIAKCEVLLALIGPNWIDAVDPKTHCHRLDDPDDFVRIEISEALARDIPVVPVLLDDARIPDVERLPHDMKELVNRQAEIVVFRTFDADVERLMRRLGLRETKVSRNHEVEPVVRAEGRGWVLKGFDSSGQTIRFVLRPSVDESGADKPTTWIVGRDRRRAQFFIADDSLSGAHAYFTYEPGQGLSLHDLGTTNGTSVDGETLGSNAMLLHDAGHEIAFAAVKFTLSRLESGRDATEEKASRAEAMSKSMKSRRWWPFVFV